MEKTISINGMTVVTVDENQKVRFIQFLPDNEKVPVMEVGSRTSGSLQQLSNGAFDYVANKPRHRSNSRLIRKAKHGRLSETRDNALQLTLKIFSSEGIDWQKAFVLEPIEIMTDLIGKHRMCEILTSVVNHLKLEGLVEE